MASAPSTPPSAARRDIAQALTQADALRLSGRKAEAETVCRRVLAAHPAAFPAMNFLALLLKDRRELGEAEQLLRQAVALAPGEAVLRNSLGSVLLQKGDVAGAEGAYRQAVALKPDYAEAQYNHGLALHKLGRTDDAMAAQRRAMSLRPNYADAMTQLAVLLHERNEHETALSVLDDALKIAPDHFSALYYRGAVLSALDRHAASIAPLQKALALRPDSHEANYVLGNALNYTGRDSEALEAYRRAIEAAPDFVNAHVDYNLLAWTMGRRDLTFTSFSYARARVGENPELLLAESEQRLRFNEASIAEELLRRARAQAPERDDILNALGRTIVTQGRFGEAIPLFEEAAAANPARITHHQELAIAYLHDRQPAKALTAIERALALGPHEQLSLGLMTLAGRETGDERIRRLVDIDAHVRTYDLPPVPGYADAAVFNRALAEDLARLHTRRSEPFDQSLRGGTQTMGKLFSGAAPTVQILRAWIDEAVADYIRKMPDDPAHPLFGRRQDAFSYAGSWSCRLRTGGYHTNHLHPQGWISSVYYVSVPDAFADAAGKEGWLKFGESNLNLGEHDRYTDAVRPRTGKLVLFPSYFWHGTIPFAAGDTRLTVAFDVVPGAAGKRQTVV